MSYNLMLSYETVAEAHEITPDVLSAACDLLNAGELHNLPGSMGRFLVMLYENEYISFLNGTWYVVDNNEGGENE